MTQTIKKLERRSPSRNQSPTAISNLNESSTIKHTPDMRLYQNIEQRYPTVDFATADYRTFIFDDNDKIDFDVKRKIKKEKQLLDPFLKNFLAKNVDKKANLNE